MICINIYERRRQILLAALISSAAFSAPVTAIEVGVGDTSVSLYGFAKLDMLYDVGDIKSTSNGLGNLINFSNIEVDGGPTSSGVSNFHAYESRVGFKTTTPTKSGDLTTVVEGDFFGSGGGEFRLRHAYGSWNRLTAGQTWTNFNTFVGTTPVLDFSGLLGRAGINRQALVRYSKDGFNVSMEAPGGVASGNSFDAGDTQSFPSILNADRKDTLPDFTLRYEPTLKGNFSYSYGGVIREVAFDNGTESDSVPGWGLYLASSYTFGNGLIVRGQFTGGDGIGSYMSGTPAPAAYRAGDKLDTISSMGGTAGVSYPVANGNINVAYSYVESDWDDAQHDGLAVESRDQNKQLSYVNYIWSPVKNVSYGVELAYASRETVDNNSGDAFRLRGTVIYSF